MSGSGLAVSSFERARQERAASSAAALLVDERVRAIVRPLADGPRQPFELEALSRVSRSTLYDRLNDLTHLGILETERISGFPLRVGYGLTEIGRVVLAGELLVERTQRRRLHPGRPAAHGGLEELVRLLAPVSRLERTGQGRCTLLERDRNRRSGAVCVVVSGKSLVVGSVHGAPTARVEGVGADWDEALLVGGRVGFRITGDRDIARSVVASLRVTLRR
jgi:DNA-binding HxlR family transcriptional regulator